MGPARHLFRISIFVAGITPRSTLRKTKQSMRHAPPLASCGREKPSRWTRRPWGPAKATQHEDNNDILPRDYHRLWHAKRVTPTPEEAVQPLTADLAPICADPGCWRIPGAQRWKRRPGGMDGRGASRPTRCKRTTAWARLSACAAHRMPPSCLVKWWRPGRMPLQALDAPLHSAPTLTCNGALRPGTPGGRCEDNQIKWSAGAVC